MTKKALPWRVRSHPAKATGEVQDRWLKGGEGVVLASVPVIGTILAMVFEWGFLSFYRVPISVAAFDVSHIVRASALTALGLAIFFGLRALMLRWDSSRSVALRLVGSCWPWMWSALLVSAMAPSYWWLPLGLIVGMVVMTVLNGWRARKNGRALSDNIHRILDLEREGLPPGPARWSNFGRASHAAFCVVAGLMLVKTYGLRTAEWRTEYWVLKQEPTLVFVERYGENLVFARFDPSTKRLQGETLIKSSGAGDLILVFQRIGPLEKSSWPKSQALNVRPSVQP